MSTLTLTASSTAATGMSTVTITGTSGTLSHTTTLALTVNAAGGTPDFSLSASPGTLTIARSAEHTTALHSRVQNVCPLQLTLAASGLPTGVTASFCSNPTPPTRTTTLFPYTTLFRSATGMSTVTITGTSGTLSHTTTLALTVNAAGGTLDFSLSASPGTLTIT